jgi:tetratricopeptide (TPR) repeat protein
MDTLYDLLGALPHDDAEGLRTAFRKAVKGAHPDLRPDDPDAALRFREIVRANEILGDPEQRSAYDHLLGLAHMEQDQAFKQQAAFTRIYKLASGVMAFAGVSIMTVGGYLLFMHMSAASVAPSDDIDTAVDASPGIVTVSAAGTVDTADKVTSSAKLPGASDPVGPGAPNVAIGRNSAERLAPANFDPASDPDAAEAKALRARGMSAYRQGNLHGAIADLDQALQRDPRFLPAYIDRGTILYRTRKIGRAFADIAPAKRVEKLDRPKPPPAAVGKWRVDQAAITGSATPSQRRKITQQMPSREEAYTPLWVR